MSRFFRFCLLLPAALLLTSCGTASHLLGRAGGLLNSVTSPVLGAIRLSDTPDYSAPSASSPPSASGSHDDTRSPAAERQN